MCTLFGILAAYTFSSIGKTCEQQSATTFQEAWSKSVDPKVSEPHINIAENLILS